MRLQDHKPLSIAIAAVLSTTLASVAAFAGDYGDDSGSKMSETDQPSEMSITPEMVPDDSWISISGSVSDIERDAFELDYGEGTITVEMDDGDRDADAYALLPGDEVRVIGRVDDDFMDSLTINAHSVQVDKLGTTFYSSAADRTAIDETMWMTVTAPIAVSDTYVTGTVKSVYDDHFTVETGMATLRVDVEEMADNPLDDDGYLQMGVGDRIVVTGEMTREFFEGRQLDAEVIVELDS